MKKMQAILKKIIAPVLLLLPALLPAQATQATLLGHWTDTTIVGSSPYDNRFNEVWSVAVNGHEYAIIGSTMGTHFIDVTDPTNPYQADFIPGKFQGAAVVHRDYKTYRHYIYGVCDEGNSSLQVMDFSTLPDSVRVAYDSNAILHGAHNISIDTARGVLYAWVFRSNTYGNGGMAVISLDDPENPSFIKRFNNIEAFTFSHIHDGYVRNDTAYLDAGYDGFAVADFSDPANPVLLGTMINYANQGYNHSGWLTLDGHYYYMADETHGSPLKTVDVHDLSDIKVVDMYNANSSATQIAHNPILACNYLYASYYYDGLQVFDVSDPTHAVRVYYYDTCILPDGDSYVGAWGVNPFLPSGNILISDMQNGLFIFKAIDEGCISEPSSPVREAATGGIALKITPQPATDYLQVQVDWPGNFKQAEAELYDATMRLILTQNVDNQNFTLNIPTDLTNGIYFLRLHSEAGTRVVKVLVQH